MGIVTTNTDHRWPGRRIPFVIDETHFPSGGWLAFKSVFAGADAGGDNRIYAVDQSGQLLSYGDAGTPGNVSNPVVVGFGGWLDFKFLFAGRNSGGDNRIYAVDQSGQLLSYEDAGTPGNVSNPVVVNRVSPERQIVKNAIAMWNVQPFAPLVPRAGESDFVRFREAAANLHSPVGRQGGEQGIFCDIGLSNQKIIPNQQSKAPPALASTGARLHMVHLGDSSNDLWQSTFDGTSWTENQRIPGQQSKASPALAFDGARLHMVHLGDSSNDIWHSTLNPFDGSDWTPNTRVAEEKSKAAPALATFGGRVHMVHLGDTSNNLWHSRIDAGASNMVAAIVHEICHAAGLMHEQSREDRDLFVAINEDEIQDGKEHNYEKRTDNADDSGLYDFDSLMHYGPFFFAKGTMIPVITQVLTASGFLGMFANIGLANGLSPGDIETLHAFYPAWTLNTPISGQESRGTPSLAEFGGLLHRVHIGRTSNDLWHSTFDGAGWSDNQKIPGQKSKVPAAIAAFGGLLHMVHLGDSSNDIWYSFFDGSGWTTNRKIRNWKSKATPALAEFGGLLHMVFLDVSSNDILHSTFDGSDWSEIFVRIPGQASKETPALAASGNLLHMVHLGDSSNDIWYSTFDGSGWSPNTRIKHQRSHSAPALAAYQGRLHMVHLGDTTNQLWHSIFDGTWRPNVPIENQSSSVGVGLAAYQNQLVMVHVGNGSPSLWHSVHTRQLGACPTGGVHDHQGSADYTLVGDTPGAPGQNNWRWCNKCQGLAFAG